MDTVKNWIKAHPNLTAWIVLAVGMVAILLWTARDVGLQGMQWFWLIVVTTLVAGACIWIINWGDDDEDEDGAVETAVSPVEETAENSVE